MRNQVQAVIFGAGNIGRGFLGDLFSQSGYRIVFIDVVDKIIERLNRDGSYHIRVVGDGERTVVVKNVSAIKSADTVNVSSHIKSADIIATAVGVENLRRIAPLIASGLKQRFDSASAREVNIIICENIIESGKHLRSLVLKELEPRYHNLIGEKVGFVATVVSRMVPVLTADEKRENPTQIKVEPYRVLPVDKPAFRGTIPSVDGFQYISNLIAYEERKLFTHNAGHAISAYFGHQKGYTYTYEAIGDPDIRSRTYAALMESGRALIEKHEFTSEEHQVHIEDLFHRFANVALGDTITRVCRDPVRKLGYNDRLIGGARLALEYGIDPVNIVAGISAALKFTDTDDEKTVELQRMLAEKGLGYTLQTVCGLNPDDRLFKLIQKEYETP